MDWCFAWLASWQLSKRDEQTVPTLYANLIASLRKGLTTDVDDRESEIIEIIDDDPELSAQKTAELTEKLETMFPREPKAE